MAVRGQSGWVKTVICAALMVVATLAVSRAVAQAQSAKPPIVGQWSGTVTSDAGSMKITATITSSDGKLGGDLSTAHGVFTFTSIVEAKGVWTLDFKTSDGATGLMKGAVKADAFSGDWDFHPRAVGTFALTRVK